MKGEGIVWEGELGWNRAALRPDPTRPEIPRGGVRRGENPPPERTVCRFRQLWDGISG